MGKKHKKDTEPDLPTDENDVVVVPEQPSKKKHKTKKTRNNREDQKIEVKIETIKPKPDKSLPLIGYFPSGYDPDKRHRVEEPPTIKLLKHVQRHNRLELSVTPSQSSKVQFVGVNYKGESAAPQMCSYALGVLDKQTKTLKIVQIEANKIFRLEPRIEGQDKDEEVDASKKAENVVTVEDSKLNFDFSTKKAQRTAKKEIFLRAYRDPAAQEDLNAKMAEAVVDTDDIEISAQASITARNIPPHDISATIPQQAYPLEKIILKGEWRYLSDITKLLQEGKAINTPSYPQFVCNRIHKLEEVKDEEVKESLACIFSYINHLIKFNDKNSMDGYSSAKHHKFPNILTQKFNDMFGNTESKRLADDKRSLLISYVLVLTLFVDDFKTEFSDIAKDLKMTAGALRPHFEFLGCKFVRENNIMLATLPAPLKFPENRRRRRR